jgi:hypothetical protein
LAFISEAFYQLGALKSILAGRGRKGFIELEIR